MRRGPAGSLQGRAEHLPPGRVPGPLRVRVLIVAERGRHRCLHRTGDDQPGVLADLQQLGDEFRVAGHETGPVPGHVGSLGQ